MSVSTDLLKIKQDTKKLMEWSKENNDYPIQFGSDYTSAIFEPYLVNVDVLKLLEILENDTTLVSLELCFYEISKKMADSLGKVLAKNRTLTSLLLFINKNYYVDFLQQLGQSLLRNKTLRVCKIIYDDNPYNTIQISQLRIKHDNDKLAEIVSINNANFHSEQRLQYYTTLQILRSKKINENGILKKVLGFLVKNPTLLSQLLQFSYQKDHRQTINIKKMDEENRALQKKDNKELFEVLSDASNTNENTVSILLDGKNIDCPGFYLSRLSEKDPRYLAFVKDNSNTDIQYIVSGLKNPMSTAPGGIYVVCKSMGEVPSVKDQIIAYSWAWHNQNALVFDSIRITPSHPNQYKIIISHLFSYGAHHLVSKNDIKRVLLGMDEEREMINLLINFEALLRIEPLNWTGPRKSSLKQCILADKHLPFFQVYLNYCGLSTTVLDDAFKQEIGYKKLSALIDEWMILCDISDQDNKIILVDHLMERMLGRHCRFSEVQAELQIRYSHINKEINTFRSKDEKEILYLKAIKKMEAEEDTILEEREEDDREMLRKKIQEFNNRSSCVIS